ncbi:MAG: hypothetical protein CVU12_10030 [Bacteroidetes bacterium HGW-Bacteroidetes-7]|jgi:Spy/CpxP family protein refolding chaperone|nr:MAG: hypothetical protein CVU12_10030 [Bacteroidetes bacterium HGW-Bacteroidetes-7]
MMKRFYITLVFALFAISLAAQNRPVGERGFMGANPAKLEPKFTTEQQEAIKNLRLELRKEMLQVENQLAEKRAQLKTLEQVEKPDMRAINSKIDEITSLQNKKMKASAANKAKVRSLMTDEQRLMFDTRSGKMHNRNFRGKMQQGAAQGMMHFRMQDGQGFRKMDTMPAGQREVRIMQIQKARNSEQKEN